MARQGIGEMRIIENSEIIELKSCHNSGTFRMKDLRFLTEIVDMSDPQVFQDWSEYGVRMQFLFTAVFDIIGERQQVILAYMSR